MTLSVHQLLHVINELVINILLFSGMLKLTILFQLLNDENKCYKIEYMGNI